MRSLSVCPKGEVLAVCVFCILTSLSVCLSAVAADTKSGEEPEKNNQVQIHMGVVLHKPNLRIEIENGSKHPIRTANIGSMGNTVYVEKPSGEVVKFCENPKLPEDYVFEPRIEVKPGGKAVIEDAYDKFLRIIEAGDIISKPGKYVLWFDIVSWIEFGKESRTYTSNKVVIFVEEGK